MPRSILSYLLIHWERRLLLLLLLAIGAFFFTRSVWEAPEPTQQQQPELPIPPQIIPWEENPPVFLQETNFQGIQNPFETQFPVEKPQPIVVLANQPTESAPPIVQETSEPKQRTIAITFSGVRIALTGKIYALLEIVDSETGVSNPSITEGTTLACGISAHDIGENSISLKSAKGEELGTIGYGENRIFIFDQEKRP